ncbi:class I SAM-dependent methyltransferase [Streptomyces sp. NPDC093225]|uniref:class I SAM-dependent methyltransferase n=1 Tax=Streptomyces sp. NPDC093225 TaxID=3366034 RepID=UPI0037F9459E
MTAPLARPEEPLSLPAPTRLDEVKGWFWPADQILFDWFLSRQNTSPSGGGDLLELGAYMGKSAIFLGGYLKEGEEFTVCDLFDSPAEDASNDGEMRRSYATLTRRAFEANYRAFHDELPTVVQAVTAVLPDRVRPASCRFVHVDASHLYAHVRTDVETSRLLAAPGAVVVFDDFRAEHCPGVAAAVWGAVDARRLHVLCITQHKMYATWDDPEPLRTELAAFLTAREDLWHGVEEVAGAPLIRITGRKAVPPPHPRSRYETTSPGPGPAPAPAPAPEQAPGPAAVPSGNTPTRRGRLTRRLGKRLLPPALARTLRHWR